MIKSPRKSSESEHSENLEEPFGEGNRFRLMLCKLIVNYYWKKIRLINNVHTIARSAEPGPSVFYVAEASAFDSIDQAPPSPLPTPLRAEHRV
jgi:hypothetical protein